MATDIIFTEGWDKYGHGSSSGAVTTFANILAKMTVLTVNEWTSLSVGTGTNCGLVPALSGTGWALEFNGAVTSPSWNKTFATPPTKAIGNCCFNYVLFGSGATQIFQFLDGATKQAAIGVDNTGHVTVVNKSNATIATGSVVWSANSVHYLAWEIDVGSASGVYKVWVDGVLSINGTGGAFNGTANTQYTQLVLGPSGGVGGITMIFDHLIIQSGSGSAITTINPIVETDFPTSDSSVQFANTAYALGAWDQGSNSASAASDAPGVDA